MSRVIMFSMSFPSYHPEYGHPTYFAEKIMAFCADNIPEWKMNSHFKKYDWYKYYNCSMPKRHTIRQGHRWKPGDKFSPRVWSGKPYRSKQIIIGYDIQVKKTWDFFVDECGVPSVNGRYIDDAAEALIAKNDGLTVEDFIEWLIMPYFKKGEPFDGQIICWDESVEY